MNDLQPQRNQQGRNRENETMNSLPLGEVLERLIGDDLLIGPPAPLEENCSVCHDRGFVYRKVPLDHPDYGMAKICDCRTRAIEAERPERLLRHWEQVTGVPQRFRPLRLETHPNLIGGDNPGLLEQLLSADLAKASWFLHGKYGRGKSGIAAGYAWRFLNETGESVLWRALPDLLEEVRSTYNPSNRSAADDLEIGHGMTEHALIQRYTSIGLLVLDDVGAERLKETGPDSWAADVLYRIIGRRHAEMRPVVFTSNLTIPDIGDRIGDRIAWRIAEMTGRENVIYLEGENLRA